MKRSASIIACGVLGLTLAGCGDFAHTSPYDLETPMTVEIVGPDVVHLGVDAQPIEYSVRTTPQSQLAAKWTCSGGVSGCAFATSSRALLTFTANGQITVRVGLSLGTKSVQVQ